MKKPEAVRWEKLEGQGDSPKLKQFTPGLFSQLLSIKCLYVLNYLQLLIIFFVLNIVNKITASYLQRKA